MRIEFLLIFSYLKYQFKRLTTQQIFGQNMQLTYYIIMTFLSNVATNLFSHICQFGSSFAIFIPYHTDKFQDHLVIQIKTHNFREEHICFPSFSKF